MPGGPKLNIGVNDLQTRFPDIAAQANGWDPTTVQSGSGKILSWKCKYNHVWNATVANRTRGSSCPICCNQKILTGFNDLKSKFPEIAKEADNWDPSLVGPGTPAKKTWKCKLGHSWLATVKSRTEQGSGCPICANKKLLAGFNDLQTKYPEIAEEAFGWDPRTVFGGTIRKLTWKCRFGHVWDATVLSRTGLGCGCPVCGNRRLLPGFNDLKTRFPDLAEEAFGWDPSKILAGSSRKVKWRCKIGHIWDATIDKRTSQGRGCPSCAGYGYNQEKDAWFYLMERNNEQQIGITNNIDARLSQHAVNGWKVLEFIGPASGKEVLKLETAFKKWLKNEIGVIEGTTENWSTFSMKVSSFAELKERSGIYSDLL
jgi:hypothetical protein